MKSQEKITLTDCKRIVAMAVEDIQAKRNPFIHSHYTWPYDVIL